MLHPCRWYRDPTLPVPRTDITRFPHAVLEVKLSLRQGEEAPEWIKVGRAAAQCWLPRPTAGGHIKQLLMFSRPTFA